MKALDKVRTRTLAATGVRDRHLMWAVRKNPADLNTEQRTTLADLQASNAELYRAYLLKEQLRDGVRINGTRGHELVAGWIGWARHCGIGELARLSRSVEKYRPLIGNTLEHAVSKARSEANNHVRLIIRRAYGFHSPQAALALVMLSCGPIKLPLPHERAIA